MSMHGLLKLHHAANKQAALEDYRALEIFLKGAGHADLVEPIPDTAGWKTIDQIAARVRKAAEARGIVFPPITQDEIYLARLPPGHWLKAKIEDK